MNTPLAYLLKPWAKIKIQGTLCAALLTLGVAGTDEAQANCVKVRSANQERSWEIENQCTGAISAQFCARATARVGGRTEYFDSCKYSVRYKRMENVTAHPILVAAWRIRRARRDRFGQNRRNGGLAASLTS